ncbi:MAG: hypothetical protein N2560_09645 [Ignavibacteria bacterium]|nr:hypothetical protein [Ignavibacteria bacterium]
MAFYDNPFELIDYANSEINSGRYSNVIEILEEGIQKFGEFPLIYFLLAKAYFEQGDYLNTQKVLELGLSNFPFNKALQQLKEDFEKRAMSDNIEYSKPVGKLLEKNIINLNFYPTQTDIISIFKKRINRI